MKDVADPWPHDPWPHGGGSDPLGGTAVWHRLGRALALLCIDPEGLGGIWLRARSGPVRDRALAGLSLPDRPQRRLHPAIADDALFGGLDLAATLAGGSLVRRAGILDRPALLVLPMAERSPPGLAARLGGALDSGGHVLIALDEGAGPDETLPPALADRLAFHLDLSAVAWSEAEPFLTTPRPGVSGVTVPAEARRDLAVVADRLGVGSLRALIFAERAARAHAALAGRDTVGPDDLAAAVELVLAPRATRFPEAAEDQPPPEPDTPDPAPQDAAETDGDSDGLPPIPQEILVEAARALLPADLLARVAAGRTARGARSASGAGAKQKGNRRGRPLPARPGRIGGGARVDLVATLRAAAPWQPMRRAESAAAGRPDRPLHVRLSDIRVKRFEEKSDRLIVFAVDASGSAAFARLAEAKGAVELLLGEAYARRDHVALVAFGGRQADLLLPPTRSLVQTKRRLAALPGGGGTPLAAGLRAAAEVALQARGRGLTPTVALLTDGRANIALDGQADRTRAASDAEDMARLLRANGIPGLVIDMGNRPEPALRTLAQTMGAPYLALPRADAGRLSGAVAAALDG